MFTASKGLNHPIAIRYPRGRGEIVDWKKPFEKIEIGEAKCLKKGTEIVILSTGTIATNVEKAIEKLDKTHKVSHYHFPFIKPLDEVHLNSIFNSHAKIITVEDGAVTGGFGSIINSFASKNTFKNKIINLGVPDNFIEQGKISELQQICKIDVVSIFNTITKI